MPVVHAPETAYAQEMRKWEAHHTQYGPPGRPYTYQAFPTRMYKATRQADGTRTLEGQTAQDEHEMRNWQSRGFVAGGPQAAMDALDKEEFTHAELAANLNHQARTMSEKAAAEIDQAQQAHGARHLPSMPEKPKRKYVKKEKPTV